ncbi:hypothetical protein PV433_08575 [Paenibacillus sp. GYB004]|uniref:hypothetical protein n=1 Tax=Paenibacillus sp. GYB004 TaxID=2994393 RepID=UPI002F96E5F8
MAAQRAKPAPTTAPSSGGIVGDVAMASRSKVPYARYAFRLADSDQGTRLQHVVSADTDLAKILNEWMDSGILQKGKGGYQTGTRAEVLLRVLGLLLR